MNNRLLTDHLSLLAYGDLFNWDKVKEVFSTDPEEIDRYEDGAHDLFYIRQKINDLRRINKYFILINEKLAENGICVCQGETIQQRNRRYWEKFGCWVFLFYPIDFLYKRVFPKIPHLRRIYFAMSNGKNRVLSKAEMLGRLYSCGFELLQLEEVDNRLHMILKKVGPPIVSDNPSYGPLFKMKKIGKDGKPVYAYKVRTMHPYAEYLRDFVVDNNGYATSGDGVGKVKDDFRVTKWGKFMRKTWLDELPQLWNILRGDLKLVGVRPVSSSFLQQYPDDFREERLKYKPGLFPPYAAHIHKSIEEYIESERVYLEAYKKHPVWTDVRYFCWIVYNILGKKIRSQ